MSELEEVIDAVMLRPTQSPKRLEALADYVRVELERHGLPGAIGGTQGELRVAGLAREKDWDVAYEFAGKFRLLISLKSIWRNAPGVVPNRLDDHMGEVSNVQHLHPEIVIGYVVVFDVAADATRKDGKTWSAHLEDALARIAIRRSPLWNQGLLEAFWLLRVDSTQPSGARVVDPKTEHSKSNAFFSSLIAELRRREPAIPFTESADDHV